MLGSHRCRGPVEPESPLVSASSRSRNAPRSRSRSSRCSSPCQRCSERDAGLCSLPVRLGSAVVNARWDWRGARRPPLLFSVQNAPTYLAAGLLGLATTEGAKALSHTISFGVTLATLTNLVQFAAQSCRHRPGSHFKRYSPAYVIAASVPLLLADQTRHVLQDSGIWPAGPGKWVRVNPCPLAPSVRGLSASESFNCSGSNTTAARIMLILFLGDLRILLQSSSMYQSAVGHCSADAADVCRLSTDEGGYGTLMEGCSECDRDANLECDNRWLFAGLPKPWECDAADQVCACPEVRVGAICLSV